MARVGVITDSIHGLSSDLIRKYDIRIAPMGLNIGNKGYRDTVDITAAQFYPLFKEAKTPSTTSAATPGDFIAIFSDLAKNNRGMIYIGVSRALTATFKIAEQTRSMFLEDHPEAKIELIDSKNCMGAVGFLALEAARAAEAGKSLAEIMSLVQSMIPRVKYLSVLDTLRYLLKIGRIPQAAASEEKFKFRPIIGMTDNTGVIQNFPPVEIDKALERLVEMAGKYIDPGKPVHAIIHHAEYVEEAEKIKQLFAAKYKPVELYVTEYSPAALSSTGLMSGISFYC